MLSYYVSFLQFLQKKRCLVCLYLQLFVFIYVFLCLFEYIGVQYILCCVFLHIVHRFFPFWIAPSVFFNIYLDRFHCIKERLTFIYSVA